jgi:hypothetical protein
LAVAVTQLVEDTHGVLMSGDGLIEATNLAKGVTQADQR